MLWRHPHGELGPGCDLHERPVIPSESRCDDIFEYVSVSQDLVVAGELLYCNGARISKNLLTSREAKCRGRCQDLDSTFPKGVLHYASMDSCQSSVVKTSASCDLHGEGLA